MGVANGVRVSVGVLLGRGVPGVSVRVGVGVRVSRGGIVAPAKLRLGAPAAAREPLPFEAASAAFIPVVSLRALLAPRAVGVGKPLEPLEAGKRSHATSAPVARQATTSRKARPRSPPSRARCKGE